MQRQGSPKGQGRKRESQSLKMTRIMYRAVKKCGFQMFPGNKNARILKHMRRQKLQMIEIEEEYQFKDLKIFLLKS